METYSIIKQNYQIIIIDSLTNYIVYLKGSHYQMGLTIGKIYRNQINNYMKLLNKIIPPTSINPLWKGNGLYC